MAAALPPLIRSFPLLRLRLHLHLRLNHQNATDGGVLSSLRGPICSSASESIRPPDSEVLNPSSSETTFRVKELSKLFSRIDNRNYRKWKDKEDEILRDVEPTSLIAKEILHSDRYMDGERLSKDDERFVLEKLLAYHPHSVDKIGSGLDAIMVDRHPQFKQSRCLFVVRTDGAWIDFSYQKCLREYIRKKYPLYAERYIREHFKRRSR